MSMKLKALPLLIALSISAAGFSAMVQAQAAEQKDANTVATKHSAQANFASPEDAVAGLAAAMRSNERQRMHEILGPAADRYIRSRDAAVDAAARVKFLAAYDEKWRIESTGDALAVLHVGNDDWPLPFPLAKHGGRWQFDAKAGERE